jgi:hypothetical protein
MSDQVQTKTFDFLNYGKALENVMQGWVSYTSETLNQSDDLGFAREHFVRHVLATFLPTSVAVGSGEIIDGHGQRSGQQDVIIYRTDFPLITSLTPVNTYLAEGVIATIEVKSNLSTGTPIGLRSAFRSVQKVQTLTKRVAILSSAGPEHEERLRQINTIRSYVIGYTGWQRKESLFKNYGEAGHESRYRLLPHAVYQPGYLILTNDGFLVDNSAIPPTKYPFLLHREYPFSMFLLHLLKTIVHCLGGLIVSHPQVNAKMEYDLGPYFDFSHQPFYPLMLEKTSLKEAKAA